MEEFQTFVEVITSQLSKKNHDNRCISFLTHDEIETWTYQDLDQHARAIAAVLQKVTVPTDRVLILLPPGLNYVAGYFGCLYAGCVAVPLYPSRKEDKRIITVSQDAQPRVALVTTDMQTEALPNIQKIEVDSIAITEAENYQAIKGKSKDIAFLQYTSGSTSIPKGVMVTHQNLLTNCQIIRDQYFQPEIIKTSCVWVPPWHDMGLIGGILFPLYVGRHAILFTSKRFIQEPLFWLKAISDYQVNISWAPNFALDLCIKEINRNPDEKLNLSCLKRLMNGGEPVQAKSIQDFEAAFEKFGLEKNVVYPGYGLAEATLSVSSKAIESKTRILFIDKKKYSQKKIEITNNKSNSIEIVSCGRAAKQYALKIVDPTKKIKKEKFQIGEIWLSGPSITAGYWNRLKDTEEMFKAHLENDMKKNYFRTGDLGFLDDKNNLYVVGRMKDVIIIRGENYYPQDIEKDVQQSHPDLLINGGAALGLLDKEGHEYLAIIHEIHRHAKDFSAIFLAIQKTVTKNYELAVDEIILIPQATIPKTSSGKVKRYACKEALLQNQLKIKAHWQSIRIKKEENIEIGPLETSREHMQNINNETAVNDIIEWLREYAERRINSRLMDERRSFFPYVILDLAHRGIFGLTVPVNYGGLGFTLQQAHKIIRQIAAIDPSLSVLVLSHNSLGTSPIVNYGTDELKKELLPKLAHGQELAGTGITEPEAGSHLGMISTTAVSIDKDRWELSGIKRWNGSGWLNTMNVFVKVVDENNQAQGLSGFVISQDMPGVRIGNEALTMGWRGFAQNSLILDKVIVNKKHLLGELNKGMTVFNRTVTLSRLAIATVSLGIMQRALQLMQRFTSRRIIATGTLKKNSVILDIASELVAMTHSLECLIDIIFSSYAENKIPMEVSMIAKVLGSSYAWHIVSTTMQLTGGRGYMENNIFPQLLRDAQVLRIVEGANEVLLSWIGKSMVQNTLDQTIIQKLNAQALIKSLTEMQNEILKIAIKSRLFKTQSDLNNWLFYHIGRLTCDTFICATSDLNKKDNKERKFIFEIMKNKREQHYNEILLSLHGKTIPTENYIMQLVENYKKSIGDIEQNSYDEDRQLDPYFSKKIKPSIITTTTKEERIPEKITNVKNWLLNWVSSEFNINEKKINTDTDFTQLGLDSIYLVRLAHEIQKAYKIPIDSSIIWQYPTISQLSKHIEEQTKLIQNSDLLATEYKDLTTEQAEKLLETVKDISEEEADKLLKKLSKNIKK